MLCIDFSIATEVDNLVAMGTNWNPAPGHMQRNGRPSNLPQTNGGGGGSYPFTSAATKRNSRFTAGYQFNSGTVATSKNNSKESE